MGPQIRQTQARHANKHTINNQIWAGMDHTRASDGGIAITKAILPFSKYFSIISPNTHQIGPQFVRASDGGLAIFKEILSYDP